MNVEIGTETPIFLFWEYLFRNFGILSLQCDGYLSVYLSFLAGFGSFVEKNLPPFASPLASFYCASNNTNCIPPYRKGVPSHLHLNQHYKK